MVVEARLGSGGLAKQRRKGQAEKLCEGARFRGKERGAEGGKQCTGSNSGPSCTCRHAVLSEDEKEW